jgi:membrane-associated HD superfamily phosphohydrolase
MPAVSKAQQRFMGMVHAAQKGDMENPSPEVEKAADSMSDKDAKDFASTSHKGLPDKKENMITRNRLKEIVKEVMVEEADYQTFFKKALEKAGKGINDMGDDEKKAFFNKIDAAWNGKGEKNEELTGGQHKLDVDKDGDIEGDDLADLRAGKTANESIAAELPKVSIPSAVKQRLEMAIDKIKDAKLSNVQKLQLIAQIVDALGVDKTQLGTIATKIRSKMESIKEAELPNVALPSGIEQKMIQAIQKIEAAKLNPSQKLQLLLKMVDSLGIDKSQLGAMASKIKSKMESVTEGVSSAEMDKIKGAVEAANSFMGVGAELKKLGMKYTFATEPLPIYIIQPTPNNRVAIVNKKYVSKPDFVVGDIAVGVMEGKSVKK